MGSHSYSSEGIILSRKNYSEADRILSIYTKDFGRISIVAKGIRKPKSKKRGHLELFGYIKFQAVKTHGFDIITEAEIIDDFNKIRKSLKKVSLAYYFMEVVGKITHEGEKNEEFFKLILSTLNKLSITNSLKKLRMDFLLSLLTLLGYWPIDKEMPNPDEVLEEVIERQISSLRVGKRMLQ